MDDSNTMHTATLLRAAARGDCNAAENMFPLIYADLRSLAERYLARERHGHTLQPTALVHEAYLKLAKGSRLDANDRTHFKAIAARAMRQTLVDHARAKRSVKRGGEAQRVTLNEDIQGTGGWTIAIITLDEVLTKLEREHKRMCKVVELRFFAGLTDDEISEALGVSPRTIREDWSVARLWLNREFEAGGESRSAG